MTPLQLTLAIVGAVVVLWLLRLALRLLIRGLVAFLSWVEAYCDRKYLEALSPEERARVLVSRRLEALRNQLKNR